MNYITGTIIKNLREQKGLTQKQLADKLMLSDKTISKWETGRGLPDISLVADIASALQTSVTELLTGENIQNENVSANLKNLHFYVCPICGNVITAIGKGEYHCCGILLPELVAENANEPSTQTIISEHMPHIEDIENEWYLELPHPMTKTHYISFFALVTSDSVFIKKLYPQQDTSCRLPRQHGMLYIYCNRHDLFKLRI